jgi:DNA-binding response OmpR family regulator
MSRDFMARRRQILVVVPPASDQYSLVGHLRSDTGYDVDPIDSAAGCAARLLGAAPPADAIVLAAELPDADGAEFCARLRQRGVNVPILLIAQYASEAQIVRGLDMGANDVLVTPVRPAEAMARLRAQIRAYETSEDAVLAIGPFHFRPARRQLLHCKTGARVRLTEKEAAVLKFLYRAAGPVTRTVLLHEVWGYNAGATTHTVETHIYRLRRKIEPDADRIGLLVNEDGGYRLRLEQVAAPTMPWSPGPHGDVGHRARMEARLMVA